MSLFGAIDIGVSGMNAFSSGLQTIGNNVANLNTLGFKESTTNFTDLFNYGGAGASYLENNNESQTGAGVKFGSQLIDFTEGTLQQSSGALDLAIQGSGFLVLNQNGTTYYTRTGQFSVGADGNIVETGTQNRLQILNSAGQTIDANINTSMTSPPAATTTATFANNLSSSATSAHVSNMTVYDSTGTKHTWQAAFTPVSGTPGSWTVTVTDETGTTVGTATLKFANGIVDPTTAKLTFATSYTGANPTSVVFDFSSVTSYDGGTASTLSASSVDGNAVGTLSSVGIDSSGNVQLTFSNTKTVKLGAVAIADFRDPQQLKQISGGLFESNGTAPTQVVASNTNGIGTLVSQELEASNVNLSSQFGDLILIQRGFQASSEVISVANDMIQNLFGIRGQG